MTSTISSVVPTTDRGEEAPELLTTDYTDAHGLRQELNR